MSNHEIEKEILKKKLKMELWKMYGSDDHPAEWDGIHHGGGGGRLSQRFWEYFKAVELLDLNKDSIVVDIGGGSNHTGVGFFGQLLSKYVKKVIIMDPVLKYQQGVSDNLQLIKEFCTFETLSALFKSQPGITHVVSISTFEHIEDGMREGIVRAINDSFKGDIFVASYEYHSRISFFENQLNVKTVSKIFSELKRFFPTEYYASPVWAENAYVHFMFRNKTSIPFKPLDKLFKKLIPAWYPVIIKFERSIIA
ncbi:MAG: hypothetical protein HQL15_00715 [Candidatus Omnitrophica bacterium]|nr:hypothetical protein [Candidatus Omnitrophota bacterium]